MRVVVAALCGLLVSVHPLLAADHRNLEEELPVRVEDAYPLEYRALEVQPFARYENRKGGVNQGIFTGRLEWGAVRNGQFSIQVPVVVGSGDKGESGDVRLGTLYNFNVEGVAVPAMSLAAEADLPTDGGSGVDTTIKGILTKGRGGHRFHLNFAYTFAGSPEAGERANRWFAGLGYDYPLNLDMLFVADVWAERGEHVGEGSTTVAEAGVRWMLTPYRLVAGGIGVGLGGSRSRPNVLATLGMQQSF